MSYKDFEEFKIAYLSKTPYNSEHFAVGSNPVMVRKMLKDKRSSSFDLFPSFGGFRACRKRDQYFEIKCGNGQVGVWDSISNTIDWSQDIDLPDEDWFAEIRT